MQLSLFNMRIKMDPEDRERVLPHPWWLSKNQVKGIVNGERVSLARYILSYNGPLIVDHINRDPWDNRKENLRLINPQQSNWNTGPRSSSRHSQYKGVTKEKGRWVARLVKDGKRHTRHAKTERDAAQKYNELAKEHHGEYAYLNPV